MGVANLWKALEKGGAVTKLDGAQPGDHARILQELENTAVAVDLSAWLVQATTQQALVGVLDSPQACVLKVVFDRVSSDAEATACQHNVRDWLQLRQAYGQLALLCGQYGNACSTDGGPRCPTWGRQPVQYNWCSAQELCPPKAHTITRPPAMSPFADGCPCRPSTGCATACCRCLSSRAVHRQRSWSG